MIDLNFPSLLFLFLPLVGLVFPAIAMASFSLYLYVQIKKIV